MELILVDDKSTDNSVEIIKKYICDKIKLIYLDQNNGPGYARNKGINLAKGEYLCFLDADDLWKREKLEKQIKFMIENQCHFSCASYTYCDKNGKKSRKTIKVPFQMSYHDYLKNTKILTSSVMIDMTYFKKEEIYMPNLRRGEDGATWLALLKKVSYVHGIPSVLLFYRKTPNSLSSNKVASIKCIWNLYRNYAHLSVPKSFYYLCFYICNTIQKRL